jgi:DNA invertase Pin-like site-specific DNA recombinase
MAAADPTQAPLSIAVGLARCSTDDQDQSIASQKAEFERFAGDHGMKLLDVFKDKGVSGSKVGNRPGVRALFSFLGRHPDKGAVLVRSRDRLARAADPGEAFWLEQEIKHTGWTLVYTDEPGTGSDLADGMLAMVKHQAAGELLKTMPKRVLVGQAQRARNSAMLVGKAPYGLARRIRTAQGERIVPRVAEYRRAPGDRVDLVPGDAEEAEVVRWLFCEYSSGRLSAQGLARELNARGVPAPKGGKWSRDAVRWILSNPAYVGDYRWNYTSSGMFFALADEKVQPKPKTGPRVRRNAPEDVITLPNHYSEPLIDRETWDRAQEVAKKRQRGRVRGASTRSEREKSPLAGLAFCGKCGASMTKTRYDKRGPILVCSGYKRFQECGSQAVKVAELEAGVFYRLQQAFAELRGPLREDIAFLLRQTLGAGGTSEADLDRLRIRVRKIRRQIQRGTTNMTLLEGEAAAYLAETLGELSGQLREAEAEIVKLEEQRTHELNVEQAADEVLARIDRLWTVGPKAPSHERREVLATCVTRLSLDWTTEQRGRRPRAA